jgi:NADP-dependent 3-hydroxy acid dehydrogenase YdfG
MHPDFKKRWVLITGASSGFGASAAREFAKLGACLLLGARRAERLDIVAAECRSLGASQVHVHHLDVCDTQNVDRFASWARQVANEVHILINNAGGAKGLDFVEQGKDEDWEFMMQTNVLGVLRVTRAVLPFIPHHCGSYIINIGSVAGHSAYEGGAAYCAAKAGELQITRSLRLELNGTGIRVGTVDPGLAETEFSLVRFKGDAERAAKVYEGTKPLHADDIAQILVWMVSLPDHVNIDELLVKPVDQAAVHKVYRRETTEK